MKYNYNQNDISTKIFDFIYSCSMHDAILQRAFEGEKEWIEKVENAVLPVIPLRGLVVFPGIPTSFEISNKKSVRALQAANKYNNTVFV